MTNLINKKTKTIINKNIEIRVKFRYNREFDTVEAYWLDYTKEGLFVHYKGRDYDFILPLVDRDTKEFTYWANYMESLEKATPEQYKNVKLEIEKTFKNVKLAF